MINNYWYKQLELSKEVYVHNLKNHKTRNEKSDSKQFILERTLSQRLRIAGKGSKQAIYQMIIACILVMKQKYEGEEIDVLFGISTKGKVLPALFHVSEKDNFLTILRNVRREIEKIEENADIDLEELKMTGTKQLGCEKLQLENSIVFIDEQSETYIPQFDEMLVYQVVSEDDDVFIKMQSYSDQITSIAMNRLFRHISTLLQNFLEAPQQEIERISMLNEEERNIIMEDFNRTECEYDKNMTIPKIIERTTKKYADKPAIYYKEDSYTFQQLDQKSNSLARKLRKLGVKNDTIVGIYLNRSFEMLISIHAIIKAGGAYLPILPTYPSSRVAYMIEDCATEIILTSSTFYSNLSNIIQNEKINRHISIINTEEQSLYEENAEPLEMINEPDDLLYIIYTSGSTGKPKGVQITHEGVINRILWRQKIYPIDEHDVIMQKTSYCFDVSIHELFWGSFTGASIFMLNQGDESNPEAIMKSIAKYNVTVIDFVPSMLTKFISYMENHCEYKKNLDTLRYVFACGEKLLAAHVNRFYQYCENENCHLVNVYGPTETTVEVSHYDCKRDAKDDIVPIGKPVDNVRLYIVDKNKQILAIGEPGELCITGIGLARGYQNNEELTKEKFITLDAVNARAYMTGDLVRWLDDGNIEYLSRNDQQVKLNGFRIELGEIETALIKHEAVEAAAVIVRTNGESEYLCAYLVMKNPQSWGVLKNYLRSILPNYMVPSYFIQVDEIPVTTNGKLDKRALEEYPLDFGVCYDQENLVTENEKEIANVWAEILPIANFYRDDNFFDLGGSSLDMITVFNKLEPNHAGLTIQDLYIYDTIRLLGEYLERLNNSPIEMIEADESKTM